MKIGLSAFAWTASFNESHIGLVEQVQEYGYSAIEVPMFVPIDLPARAIRRAVEASEMECTVCAILPSGINPISPEAGTRKRSLAHLIQCVEVAATMGVHLLGGPMLAPIGYLPDHRPTEDEWKWAIEGFQSLGDVLDKYDMTLCVEPVNRSETFFVRTASEAAAFCGLVAHPRIGVTLDTFHANIEEKSIIAAIGQLGSRLKHFHASENDRGLLGTGHINFAGCLKTLAHIQYDGYLIIEGFGYSPGEPSSPGALWADINVSPEQVAIEGYSYLKSLDVLVD